jgi:putative membrane protein
VTTRRHLHPSRLLRTMVLVGWAAFFAYLYLSREMTRYLGPRTYWVVPFGAALLGIAVVAHVPGLRSSEAAPRPSRREVIGHVVLIAPLLAALVVPAPALGALAANKKSTGGGLATVSSVVPPDPSAGREVRFLEIHYANESQEFADAIGIVDGYEVSLVGFVGQPTATPEGAFDLTRFYVSCCAADAIPYSVMVVDGPRAPIDTWLRVTGHLERRNSTFVLVPDAIDRIGEPKDPYLY